MAASSPGIAFLFFSGEAHKNLHERGLEWWNEDGAELVAQTELSGAVMLTAPLCLFLLKTDVQRFVSSIG